MKSLSPQGKESINKATGEIHRLKLKNGFLKADTSKQDARSSSRNLRYKLQSHSGSILKGERVCRCCKVNIESSVDVYRSTHNDKSKSAHYGGLMFCGSVWHCPVCGAKIAERRSHELREAFDEGVKQGYNISHITFTFPHQRTDSLQQNLSSFLDAFKRFWDSAPMRRFKEDYGLMGRIRALETTWSEKNGFHPHIHLITFTEKKFDHLDAIKEQLLKVWNDKLVRCGLNPANHHGINIQNGDKAGEYINKFADDSKLTKSGSEVTWDMADEMTKLNSKSGRQGSLTPFDFLRIIDNPEKYGFQKSDASKFVALFKEYGEAFKGRSQLEWGRGSLDVRKNLGLKDAKSDQDLVDEVQEEATKILSLPMVVFKKLIPKRNNGYRDLRSTLLTVCETKSISEVHDFLYSSCFANEMPRTKFMQLLRLGNYQFKEKETSKSIEDYDIRTPTYDHERAALNSWLSSHSV